MSTLPPFPGHDLAPAPRPPVGPSFIGTNLQFGKIGDGENLAIGFLFTNPEGHDHVVVLTNDAGVLVPELAEILGRIIDDITPGDTTQPAGTCGGCGQRIFGPLIDVGFCLTCKPS